MAKFLILFIGGSVPEDKKQQNITDRLAWMNGLGAEGMFIDGSPLKPEGIMIHTNTEARYAHDDDSVNGYAIIDVDDIDAAVDVAQLAPQVKPEYGSATAEIRPLLSLI
jgi:hypothetical protein